MQFNYWINTTKSILSNLQVFIIPLNKNVVKIFLPSGKIRLLMEWNGNLSAQNDFLWSDVALPLTRIPFGFIMRRGRVATNDDYILVKNFLFDKLNCLNPNIFYINADKLVDEKILTQFQSYGLKNDSINDLLKALSNYKVPLSSSHGDIHIDNVIFLHDQLYLIDWSLYRKNSTILLDILHLPIRYLCSENKISWVEAINLEIPEWVELSNLYSIDISSIRILYTLDRVSREVEQNGGLIHSNSEKYLKAIKSILPSD